MHYLEVKLDVKQEDVDTDSFISDIIKAQDTLGTPKRFCVFNSDVLDRLGFIYNPTTNGYGIEKKLNFEQVLFLTKEISKLEKHNLTHGYLQLKIHEDNLYIWDTALIYEGLDTFEYSLAHHNIFTLDGLHVVTKSDSIHEDILEFMNYTQRYSEPSLDFIIQGYFWDKKEGEKVMKSNVLNSLEYIKIEGVISNY